MMGDELPKPASTLTGAVFLSYASEDTAAAERIATALRSAGIEVWFDKSELRGGDLWDRQIRAQIHKCRLFIPVVSGSTDARVEGYFRREWRLAVDRTRDLSERISFLVPVVIDSTSELRADVPDAFRNVQWTRLPGGETPSAFRERVRQLLTRDLPSEPAAATKTPVGSSFAQISTSLSGAYRGHKLSVWILGAVIALGVAYLSVDRFWLSRHAASSATNATVSNDPVAFTAPEKSIAVLPFIDMSEKHDQEYFSDGLAEELLDLLAKTPGLHVIARTSSFSLKGKSDDIPTIGARLRVANILEGSVRKSGENLRVTTQLVRADTAEHLWSETYEVTARDIFKVQDEIAGAVVSVLKLKLVQGQRTAGTANPAAYNEYLLARQHQRRETKEEFQRAIAAYQRAVALDPHYVAAIAGLASAEYRLADVTSDSTGFNVARSHAAQAIFEGPGEAEGYAVRGGIRSRVDWDWVDALADLQRAVALNPGDAGIQRLYGELLGLLGRFPEATAALNMATRLDPLSSAAWDDLGLVLMASQDYRNARQAFGRELEIQPEDPYALDNLGTLQLITHDPAAALATYLRISEAPLRDTGVALAEHSLGHEQQSQRALEGAIAEGAQGFASQIADVFAWCGQRDEAFAWLERAREQHDGGLAELNTDVLLASLHDDPRYRTLRHNINLPD
jgi:TolB-like protein/cytochrome c-type biogenesis protein CcmH/NrfG